MSEEEKLLRRVLIIGFSLSLLFSILVFIFERFSSSLLTLLGGIFSIVFFLLLKGIVFKFLEKKSFIYVFFYIARLALIVLVFYVIIIFSKKDIIYFFVGFLSIIFAIMVEALIQFLKLRRETK